MFIGPNNAVKTAVLEALRIALTSRWGKRGTGFTDYDLPVFNLGALRDAADQFSTRSQFWRELFRAIKVSATWNLACNRYWAWPIADCLRSPPPSKPSQEGQDDSVLCEAPLQYIPAGN